MAPTAEDALEAALTSQPCDLWAVFDPAGHYGAAYLDDAVAAFRYARGPLLGRAAHYEVDGDGGHRLLRADDEHRLVDEVPSATLVARAGDGVATTIARALRAPNFRSEAGAICALHRFNFATAPPRAAAEVDLDWRRG